MITEKQLEKLRVMDGISLTCEPEIYLKDVLDTLSLAWKVIVAGQKATAHHVSHENSRQETRTVEIWEKEFLDLKEALAPFDEKEKETK